MSSLYMSTGGPQRKYLRNKFTEDEDNKLKQLVDRYGDDWCSIANEMTGRGVRQCKERWSQYLAPDIVRREWTEEEDMRLEQKVTELGRRWIHIKAFFPGRTDTSLKNRFNLLCRRRIRQWQAAITNLSMKTIYNPRQVTNNTSWNIDHTETDTEDLFFDISDMLEETVSGE